jgi:hypothetical protein
VSIVHEFVTPIPVETKQGRGLALFVEVDNHVQYWTIVLNDSRAFVTLAQDRILACRSYTHGRDFTEEQMAEVLRRARSAD